MKKSKAYLAGVLVGDGYLSKSGAFGLHVKDRDFAEAFSSAILNVYGIAVRVRPEGSYWRVSVTRKNARFFELWNYRPARSQMGAWLRGFFDSEGNVNLIALKSSPNSWSRRVAFYNTEEKLIRRAQKYLKRLGIEASIRPTKAHKQSSHHGTKVVYELRLRSSKTNYQKFLNHVDSSIKRKHLKLVRIPASYSDRTKYSSLGGKRGAATRWNDRTHCAYGHELTGDNVVMRRSHGRTTRRCRECCRRWVRESRQRKKQCAV